MPLAINIDASDFITQSSLSNEEMNSFKSLLLDQLADGFKEEWMNQVNENLHSTRQEYLRGVFVDRPSDDVIIMGVTARKSKLAVNLELGMDAFDEKQNFAQSPKRTMKKDGKGWYITVPFRFSTPTALGESSVFSNPLPLAVYKIAKNQTSGVKQSQLPIGLQTKGVREGFNSAGRSFKAYTHKASLYEGLIKVKDRDENRSQYMTFRRVSDLSDQNAWIHPGFLPHNFLGKALDRTDITSIVRRAKIDFFKNRM
jgi:hypothetical protein